MVTMRADFTSGTTARARRFYSQRRPAALAWGERGRLFLRGTVGGRARDRPPRQRDRADAARVGWTAGWWRSCSSCWSWRHGASSTSPTFASGGGCALGGRAFSSSIAVDVRAGPGGRPRSTATSSSEPRTRRSRSALSSATGALKPLGIVGTARLGVW